MLQWRSIVDRWKLGGLSLLWCSTSASENTQTSFLGMGRDSEQSWNKFIPLHTDGVHTANSLLKTHFWFCCLCLNLNFLWKVEQFCDNCLRKFICSWYKSLHKSHLHLAGLRQGEDGVKVKTKYHWFSFLDGRRSPLSLLLMSMGVVHRPMIFFHQQNCNPVPLNFLFRKAIHILTQIYQLHFTVQYERFIKG